MPREAGDVVLPGEPAVPRGGESSLGLTLWLPVMSPQSPLIAESSVISFVLNPLFFFFYQKEL